MTLRLYAENKHLPLERYYHPDEFAAMKVEALALGRKAHRLAPTVARNCGKAFNAASWRRQSYRSRQYATSSRR